MRLQRAQKDQLQLALRTIETAARRMAESIEPFFACADAASAPPRIEAVPDLALAAVEQGAKVPPRTSEQQHANLTAQRLHGSITVDAETLFQAFGGLCNLTGIVFSTTPTRESHAA